MNDIVIICDEDAARNEWKMARVVECIKSHDNQIRSVKLLIGSKLYPLEKDKRQYLVRPVSKVVVIVRASQKDNSETIG